MPGNERDEGHLLILAGGDLLQEGGNVLAPLDLESQASKEGHDALDGTMIDQAACTALSRSDPCVLRSHMMQNALPFGLWLAP